MKPKTCTPVGPMRLDHLIRQLHRAVVRGPVNRCVRGIAYDARRVSPDSVFVALPASAEQRLESMRQAMERGAAAIICDAAEGWAGAGTLIRVPDVEVALAQAARSYYEHPCTKLQVIGVTGGRAAAEVAVHLQSMLQASGRRTGLISSLRYEMGERLWPAGPIPPCALEVQAALAAMVGAGCQACVIETGPPAAAAKHLAGVDFDLVIHSDGLDCAGWDRPRPVPAASRLARRPNLDLKERDNSKTANIDIDVVFGTRATRTTELTVQLAHGDPTPLLLRAVQLVLDQHGACCSVKLPGRWGVCRLSPPSRSALARLLGAAAAALRLGVPEARVAGFLIQPRPVPGRLERIDAGQPYAVFVDRAETPESLECALRELRAVTPGRLRVMIGCAGTTDLAFRREMGRIAAELADHTIVTSHNPGSASPLQIAADMASGTQAGSRNVDIVIDRSQAIRRAMRLAAPGDTVLLAGKGHETFQFENHTIVPFDDRRLARQALEDWGWS